MYDVIILGAGPAGVSASLYSASRGLKTLVIEKGNRVGGTINNVSNITHYAGYPSGESGEKLIDIWEKQLLDSGVKLVKDTVTGVSLKEEIKVVSCQENSYEGKCVIIATGTTQNIPKIKGEEKLIEKHLHNNSFKYAKNYKNAVVIGGSDGASKEAIYISKYVNHVDVLVLGDHIECVNEFSTQIKNIDNITVHLSSQLISIDGKDNIEKLNIENKTTNKNYTIENDNIGIFYYIGSSPNTDLFKELDKIKGYLKVDEHMQTSIEGVYAIGDVRVKQVRQISTAVSDGAIAAIEASKYILT
ncbi:NAD(P)/FAD-dependent oxidoreductase [Miniphocaeibacter massiliensis]|uniref:NAD(P)/FAD-dependent oxidoreductase n=1 Tax=Miniphocaeibacter massiliensis TaxID=2041841 RepID=UPI0013EC872C|nr:NAD(P)/FAD-dependent oxidoreductase [Miniphocaeibacter massiliensis]